MTRIRLDETEQQKIFKKDPPPQKNRLEEKGEKIIKK